MTSTSTTSVKAAAAITSVTLEVPDAGAADGFYQAAFGLGTQVRVRESQAPTTGFRGFTLSLVVSQPSTVDSLVATALDAGREIEKVADGASIERQLVDAELILDVGDLHAFRSDDGSHAGHFDRSFQASHLKRGVDHGRLSHLQPQGARPSPKARDFGLDLVGAGRELTEIVDSD